MKRTWGAQFRTGAGLAGLYALFAAPLALVVLQSFAGRWAAGALGPETLTLQAWQNFSRQPGLWGDLGVSIVLGLGTVALSALLAWPAARTLAWRQVPARHLWQSLLLAPALVPALATAFGQHRAFSALGLADGPLAVVLVLTFSAAPYLLRSLQTAYEALDPRLSEAALQLGARPWRRFWTIEVPLVFPGFLSGGAVVFLIAFSDYFLVSLFGGGLVSAFSTRLMPALASAQRSWASVLTLVFTGLPLAGFALLEALTLVWRRRRGLGG